MVSAAALATTSSASSIGRLSRVLLRTTIERRPIVVTGRTSTSGAVAHGCAALESDAHATAFCAQLSPAERARLTAALKALDDPQEARAEAARGVEDPEATLPKGALRALFLFNALPFVGFGVLDNAIMIMAGEYIETWLGASLCISTMAAAALGNAVSDVAGIGLAHHVETVATKIGVRAPPLSSTQLELRSARIATNSARAAGLLLGCIVGMFPLLLFNRNEKQKD